MMYNRFLELTFENGTVIGGRTHFDGFDLIYPPQIEFDINKDAEHAPNDAQVTIYNLDDLAVRAISTEGLGCDIKAGYWPDGGEKYVGTIFKGKIRSAITDFDGVDKKTVLTIGDGDKQYAHARVRKKTDGKPRTIVAAALESMQSDGLLLGLIDVPDVAIFRPLTFNGESARSILNDVCRSLELQWFILDGVVNVHPRTAWASQTDLELTAQTGLIGRPVKSDLGLDIDTLLIHELKPSMLVNVNSVVSGQYKVQSVQFRGNNQEGDFGCSVKLIEIVNGKAKRSKERLTGNKQ